MEDYSAMSLPELKEEAKKLGKIDYFAQGTVYPDIVESGSDKKGVVKSHHNVGGLPEHVDLLYHMFLHNH